MIAALVAAAMAAAGCSINPPIVGSAGYENAQVARRTNTNTYSASAFSERAAQHAGFVTTPDAALKDGWAYGTFASSWTFGAAKVPTLCLDEDPGEGTNFFANPQKQWEGRDRVYLAPLDVYATNVALGAGLRGGGVFYSASVTQSVLGQRIWALPGQVFNVYPLLFAPVVGNYSRGDGLTSYSVDWIGGGYLDTPYGGVRFGYLGATGLYGSADERVLGLFGTATTSKSEASTPWSYLRAGIQAFSLRRFGKAKAADAIGASSLFLRDTPFGGGADPTAEVAAAGADRLRTVHLQQDSIARLFDGSLSANLLDGGLYEGHFGVHTAHYHADRETLEGGVVHPDGGAGLVRLGVVRMPSRYVLGLGAATLFSARAELRLSGQEGHFDTRLTLLFNDPDQLVLYPFARNALSVNLVVFARGGG